MGKKQRQMHAYQRFFYIWMIAIPLLLCGCSYFREESKARSSFEEANTFFSQGNYQGSLDKYQQIIEKYPKTGDRVLFEIGFIYSYPTNQQKDYRKSLQSFQKLINDFPASPYRHDSEMMIFYINNVILKDKTIAGQQARIGALQQAVAATGNEIATLQRKIEELQKKVTEFALQKRTVDKILVEKKERRLTLMSNGEVLKTYRIALGGNPNGPKEREGDNKTPEGTYYIDSRNKDSKFHLALHLSYPNERDKKRAKELGVSPGGGIMIHGLKNGFSWVGDLHSDLDWTKGCIAVTDEEIEEIAKLAPNGTVVEIRP